MPQDRCPGKDVLVTSPSLLIGAAHPNGGETERMNRTSHLHDTTQLRGAFEEGMANTTPALTPYPRVAHKKAEHWGCTDCQPQKLSARTGHLGKWPLPGEVTMGEQRLGRVPEFPLGGKPPRYQLIAFSSYRK